MEKIFLVMLLFILTSCEIKDQTKQTLSQEKNIKPKSEHINRELYSTSYIKDGVEYIVFTLYSTGGNGGRSVYVINHTKDQLQMENLKLQNEKLKLEIQKLK